MADAGSPIEAPVGHSDPAAGAGDAAAGPAARRTGWDAERPINLRLSGPLPFGRYYLTVAAGRERRSAGRLAGERRQHPLVTLGNVVLLFAVGTVLGLAGLAVIQLIAGSILERGHMMAPPPGAAVRGP